jgi:hypothetical protein
VFEDCKGRIWAGTARGLSLFDPRADTDPPHTLLSETHNQHEAGSHGEVTLTFSGIDKWKYTDTRRLLFFHRVDGAQWSPFPSGSSAVLRHLPAGNHRFEVKAMDRNGNVDAVGAASTFWFRSHGTGRPAFWA